MVMMSFGFLQKVSFLMFGDKWWQYAVDTIQAIGSLATAGTLIWIIHSTYQDKKEKETERKESAFSLMLRDLIDLVSITRIHNNFKISYAISKLESDFIGDIRENKLHEKLAPLRVHINQTTQTLNAEYLIGIEPFTGTFPKDIYGHTLVADIKVSNFRKKVEEVAYLIAINNKFSLLPIGNLNFIQFKTRVDIDVLNKLVILAQPIFCNYLEKSADISWLQEDLKNISQAINGLDVAAYVYVLNHENGKALVKALGENHG